MRNTYSYSVSSDLCRFEFDSVGRTTEGSERVIRKEVELTLEDIKLPDDSTISAYNLSLVDVLPDGRISDTSRSNNGDMKKVLSTVAGCVATFLVHHPDAIIYFKGSTEARTKLYGIYCRI